MANYLVSDYQLNYARYKHYYRQIWKFYSRPAVKVSSALLLTIFTTIFFAVFAIRPTLTTVAELINTIKAKEEILTKLKQKAASLNTAQSQYSANSGLITKLDKFLPDNQEIQSLINLIEAVAADNNLVIDSYNVSDFEYIANPSLPSAVTLPISLSAQADYNILKDFLYDISRLPRLITINSISFSEPDDNKLNNLDTNGYRPINISIQALMHYMPLSSQSKQPKNQ